MNPLVTPYNHTGGNAIAAAASLGGRVTDIAKQLASPNVSEEGKAILAAEANVIANGVKGLVQGKADQLRTIDPVAAEDLDRHVEGLTEAVQDGRINDVQFTANAVFYTIGRTS